jgi:hypothetical protein
VQLVEQAPPSVTGGVVLEPFEQSLFVPIHARRTVLAGRISYIRRFKSSFPTDQDSRASLPSSYQKLGGAPPCASTSHPASP